MTKESQYIFILSIVTVWSSLESEGPKYGIQSNIWYMKKNIKSLIFPTKKAEAYGGSLYHEIVYLGLKPS